MHSKSTTMLPAVALELTEKTTPSLCKRAHILSPISLISVQLQDVYAAF